MYYIAKCVKTLYRRLHPIDLSGISVGNVSKNVVLKNGPWLICSHYSTSKHLQSTCEQNTILHGVKKTVEGAETVLRKQKNRERKNYNSNLIDFHLIKHKNLQPATVKHSCNHHLLPGLYYLIEWLVFTKHKSSFSESPDTIQSLYTCWPAVILGMDNTWCHVETQAEALTFVTWMPLPPNYSRVGHEIR